MTHLLNRLAALGGIALALWLVATGQAVAAIAGITGPSFGLTARADTISTADGNSVLTWGYANGGGAMQYPGPTLIVNQGDTVSITLTNALAVPTSIVFPGQSGVSTSCPSAGTAGLMTCEAAPGGTVTYTFTASQPGTFLYHSGTQPSLQVEMGLVGALIVRPPAANQAYGHPGSAYDREYLLLLTEMDPKIHEQVGRGNLSPDMTNYFAVQWFINGRNGMDTLLDDNVATLPRQPYGSVLLAHPGEKVLARLISAGRDPHPFHFHGNNVTVIARDGRLLESTPGSGPDLAWSDFTVAAVPGATYDALFEWTGKNLGWDIYDTVAKNPHDCVDSSGPLGTPDGFDDTTREWCPDHDKPIPVTLPTLQDVTVGMHYSGSPYLGASGALPVGEGGYNPYSGYFYMWHSHTEKELTNNDIFPGGMMTMFVVVPNNYPLP
jgi:FtsP/CotA-like multicopper oxidase with cupredoxin domain